MLPLVEKYLLPKSKSALPSLKEEFAMPNDVMAPPPLSKTYGFVPYAATPFTIPGCSGFASGETFRDCEALAFSFVLVFMKRMGSVGRPGRPGCIMVFLELRLCATYLSSLDAPEDKALPYLAMAYLMVLPPIAGGFEPRRREPLGGKP